jgi:hypothetical protein
VTGYSYSVTNPFIGGLRRGATAASHFLILSNLAARDPRMSLRARGLFTTGMSFKEGWKITEQGLACYCTDGEKSIRAALLELRELGYVYRGQRSRYPAGTKNHKGKDISGALGPYEWWWTDKPEEIATILLQYAKEQHTEDGRETAGGDNLPYGHAVAADPVDNPAPPAPGEASPDQGKEGIPPGVDNLPRSSALEGSTKEDHEEEDQEEDQEQGHDGYAVEPAALRLAGPDDSAAAEQGGPDTLDPVTGDQQHARAENVARDLRALDELAGSRKWEPPVPPPAPVGRPQLRGGRRRVRRDDLDPDTRAELRAELAQRGTTPLRAVGAHPDGPQLDAERDHGRR